ncbi:MAG: hypothetical protein AB8I08_33585 [Sandaracinaceae bacterium]
MQNAARAAILLIALTLGACGGAGEVGEACGTPGSTDECVDGAICHDRSSGDAEGLCRLRCSDDTDCPGGGSCEDVSDIDGDVKGCI